MKDREYFRDMDFSHRGSIEEQESQERWEKKHGPELEIRALIRKLCEGGVSEERIYLTLVSKMKQIWPYNNSQTMKNIIKGECRDVVANRKSKQNKQQDDFEDR